MKPVSETGIGRMFRDWGKHVGLRPVSLTLPLYNGSNGLRLILRKKSGACRYATGRLATCKHRARAQDLHRMRVACARNHSFPLSGNVKCQIASVLRGFTVRVPENAFPRWDVRSTRRYP